MMGAHATSQCHSAILVLLGSLLGMGVLAAETSVLSGSPEQSRREECGAAVLGNGFTIRYVRRDVGVATTRLWLCDSSSAAYVIIPSDQIEGFEEAEQASPEAQGLSSQDTESAIPRIPPARNPIQKAIWEVALRNSIDPDFLASVVDAESRFNPTAVSPKGAQGLMQLMPRTAAGLGVRNAFDPAENLEAGTKYLRQLLDHYRWDAVKALAAYNAGPQRVQQYAGIPPFAETRAYVTRIIEDFNRKKVSERSARSAKQAMAEDPSAGSGTPATRR